MAFCRYCGVVHKFICDCSLDHIDHPSYHGTHLRMGHCMMEGCTCEGYSQVRQVTVEDLEKLKADRERAKRRMLREEKKKRARNRERGYSRWLKKSRREKRHRRD